MNMSIQARMSPKVYKLNVPSHPIQGEVTIPGSKSYTNRALILASLADGVSRLISPSLSDDSTFLITALQKLGVEITKENENLVVKGVSGKFKPFKGEINLGAAGTSMRFIVSICALVSGGEIILSGSERMHERPIEPLVNSLSALGVEIDYLKREGCPPLKIIGNSDLQGGRVKIPGSVSSQFFSSLMMVGGLLKKGLEIEVDGDQVSRTYIDMTIDSMRAFGIKVENHDYKRYVVPGLQPAHATNYQVEGDVSGASYLWGLAAISGGRVKVRNVNPASAQGDIRFPDILARMGCEVRSGVDGTEGWIEVQGSDQLQGVEVDMTLMPDTAQSLAVVSVVANGNTRITGLGTLRIKETDRILAVQQELSRLGISTEVGPDWITVIPKNPMPGRIQTYDDHRMAMSFAMLAARFPGINIEHPQVVTKSFPQFWQKLSQLGISYDEES